jgi:hypothetical protein
MRFGADVKPEDGAFPAVDGEAAIEKISFIGRKDVVGSAAVINQVPESRLFRAGTVFDSNSLCSSRSSIWVRRVEQRDAALSEKAPVSATAVSEIRLSSVLEDMQCR